MTCTGLETEQEKDENTTQSVFYDLFFVGKTSEMVEVAKVLMKRLKVRDKLLDDQEQE